MVKVFEVSNTAEGNKALKDALNTKLKEIRDADAPREVKKILSYQVRQGFKKIEHREKGNEIAYKIRQVGDIDPYKRRLDEASEFSENEIDNLSQAYQDMYGAESEKDVIKAYVVGGLAGFVKQKGKEAEGGEISVLPGPAKKPLKSKIMTSAGKGKSTYEVDEPTETYPIGLLATELIKKKGKSDRMFITLSDTGEDIKAALDEINSELGKDHEYSIVGRAFGPVEKIEGKVFKKAAPRTEADILSGSGPMRLFQARMNEKYTQHGGGVVHTHGDQLYKWGHEPSASGHIDAGKFGPLGGVGIYVATKDVKHDKGLYK